VNMHPKCNLPPLRVAWLLVLVFLVLAPPPLRAQVSPIADRLPPGTVFYVQWRGKAFVADADKQNHLLQLLEDPDITPLRELIITKLQQGGTDKVTKFDDIVSLLDNRGVFGVVVNPPKTDLPATGEASSPVGVYLVYDATGKRELIQKLKASSQTKDASPVATYGFNGTQIEVRTTGKDTSYSALTADYYIFADQKPLIEDLIARFRSAAPPTSISQIPEYQSIKKNLDANAAIEYFARMPDLKAVVPHDQKQNPVGYALLQLHLDKIHAFGGSVSFSGPATRFQGEILGDTSPGSLFDIAGPSAAEFATEPIVGNNPQFSVSRLDLAALYKLIRGAVVGAVSQQQLAGITAAEAMAQSFLGMSIPDALGLFTGEFASASSYADDGTELRVFAATIQKPADLLRVVRAAGATTIVAEDSSGDTTFLDLAFPYKDPANGQPRKKFYYVAVTPQMLLAAPRKTMLRDAIARLNSKSATRVPGAIFQKPEYLQLRSHLPEKLSGLSAADIGDMPWDKIFASFATQIEEGVKKSPSKSSTDLSWITLVKPEIIPRHLHMSVGGWWKDANGIHFDSYTQ